MPDLNQQGVEALIQNLLKRLLRHVVVNENGCWSYVSKYRPTKSSKERYAYVNISAHRLAYFLFNGPIDEKLDACHSCDHPRCINPEHLWPGTKRDNLIDALKKGIHTVPVARRGEANHQTKLTEEQVKEMRRIYESGKTSYLKLGKMFGVRHSTAFNIVKRNTWFHVE